MSTNMTRFRWFSKVFTFLCFGRVMRNLHICCNMWEFFDDEVVDKSKAQTKYVCGGR